MPTRGPGRPATCSASPCVFGATSPAPTRPSARPPGMAPSRPPPRRPVPRSPWRAETSPSRSCCWPASWACLRRPPWRWPCEPPSCGAGRHRRSAHHHRKVARRRPARHPGASRAGPPRGRPACAPGRHPGRARCGPRRGPCRAARRGAGAPRPGSTRGRRPGMRADARVHHGLARGTARRRECCPPPPRSRPRGSTGLDDARPPRGDRLSWSGPAGGTAATRARPTASATSSTTGGATGRPSAPGGGRHGSTPHSRPSIATSVSPRSTSCTVHAGRWLPTGEPSERIPADARVLYELDQLRLRMGHGPKTAAAPGGRRRARRAARRLDGGLPDAAELDWDVTARPWPSWSGAASIPGRGARGSFRGSGSWPIASWRAKRSGAATAPPRPRTPAPP